MRTENEVDERLSRPSAALIEELATLEGDIVVIGAGGKLGPSLVNLAANALQETGSEKTVFAVSRFGSSAARASVERDGVQVVPADIADDDALRRLPDAQNVVFLVGEKFGSAGNSESTWATNSYLPGRVAERYRGSRFSALSTGTVYPLVRPASGGSRETDELDPVGDYAMSCVGREKILSHFAARDATPLALIRLNYAVEMRYGILIDLATMILSGQPVDVSMAAVNVVWQGYANEVTLRALLRVDIPPFILNVTGPETIAITHVAERLAAELGKTVEFVGEESDTAFLSDASRCHGIFGYPELTVDELVRHTAEWMLSGGPTHGKPTKFQKRDGRF